LNALFGFRSGPRCSARFAVALGVALCGACASDYPLPPTACDDYCHATQRGDCDDDSPADCVRDCEANNDASLRESCADAWRARDDCYLRLARSAFSCDDGKSRPPDACLDERRAVVECFSPGTGSCFDECVRQANSCGDNLTDCEHDCVTKDPECRASSNTYARCLQDYPVACKDPLTPDPRPPEEVPCFDEALDFLACVMYRP